MNSGHSHVAAPGRGHPVLMDSKRLQPEVAQLLDSHEFRTSIAKVAQVVLIKRAAAEGDVLKWGRLAMPDKFNLPPCKDLHGWLVEQRLAEYLAARAPRGFAKTTTQCNLIPMYQALVEPDLFNFYLTVQANDEKATSVNRAIKMELEQNELLQLAYGRQVTDRWTDSEFELRNGVVFKSVGAGASMRGIQYRNRRPDYVTLDDPYDENELYSLEATERVNRWIKGTLLKVLARSRRSAFHVTNTLANTADITLAMEKWPQCVSRAFSSLITEADGSKRSLWPEMLTVKQLEEDRERMGSFLFDREMQSLITDDTESIVKTSWLEKWEFDPELVFSRFTKDFHITNVMLGHDPSTGTAEGDPAGFAMIVETQGPGTRKDWWLMDAEDKVMSWDERLGRLERMHSAQNALGPEFRVRRARVEGIGGFKDYGEQAKLKTSLPVDVVTFTKGKIAHLAQHQSKFEFGKFHVSKKISIPLQDKLREQLTKNKPKHDDFRDAVLLALDASVLNMKDWV